MRPQFLMVILLAALVMAAMLFWHYSGKEKTGMREAQVSVQHSNTPSTVAPTENSPTASVSVPTGNGAIAASNKAVAALKVTLPEIIESHNLPVNFWGEVVDQDGKPLSGTRIVMSIRQAGYSPATGLETLYPKKETLTDSNGRFQWIGNKGDRLSVDSVELPGYELEPNAQHDFGTSSGSPENPVIFKMWRTNVHERLITGQKHFQIVPDGRPYFINLTEGTIATSGSGDLKVLVKYSGQKSSEGTNNWFSEIDVINGGLLEQNDAYSSMFFAPTNGYIPTFLHEGWIMDNQSGSTGTRRFYVMLKGGQEYGRITIELIAPFNRQIPGLIRLSYTINPSGSRILR